MMWIYRALLGAALTLIFVNTASPQSVTQSGAVTPGHAVKWVTNGVVGDAGTAASGTLTSLGVTNNGGPAFCANSGPITGPYNQLCLSAGTTTGGKISLYNFGGATGGFVFDLNGTSQGFPLVTLPVSTGFVPCFANTAGNLNGCSTPLVPTAIIGTNTTQAASTAFVQAAIAGIIPDSGGPIFILATGQSNMVQRPSYSWTPAPNAFRWNNSTGVDGSVGTAFAALSAGSINVSDKFASDIAYANPTRQVYLLNVSFGSQTIVHWLPGAPSPDVYANILLNITPAMTAAGVTAINTLLWWQGENQTDQPWLYTSQFNAVMTRFQTETWFALTTPTVVFGLVPESQNSFALAANTDTTNKYLQAAVVSNSDTRQFIYTGIMTDSSYWDGSLHPSGLGMFTAGALASNEFLYGQQDIASVDQVRKVINADVIGRPAFRNLVVGGDLTTNPWRYGTSFAAAANGTAIAQNFSWIQSGTGVVTVRQAVSAPTNSQAGMFTQNSIDVEITTADVSVNAPNYYGIEHTIDARSASFLGFGQASPLNITVSFWVNHSIVGNYFVYIENEARTASYTTQYVVNTANTWEKKTLTIRGPPSGTFNYTSGIGLRVGFPVASSSTYLFTPNVWNTGDVRIGNVTRANGLSTIGNHFRLALIQVEEGLGGSAFEQLPVSQTSQPKGIYVVGTSAAAVPITGTLVETTLATIAVPANSMGPNGALRITTIWSNNNPGATGTYRIKYNGTTVRTVSTTSSVFSGRTQVGIQNRNATNSQLAAAADQANWATSVSAPITMAHDTTTALNVTITGQLANTGDTITSESYLVELIIP